MSLYARIREERVSFCVFHFKNSQSNKDCYLFLTDELINIHDAGMEYIFQLDRNYCMFVFRPSLSFFLIDIPRIE